MSVLNLLKCDTCNSSALFSPYGNSASSMRLKAKFKGWYYDTENGSDTCPACLDKTTKPTTRGPHDF